MCNLYSHRKGPAAIIDLFDAMTSTVGNLVPADYYPDYPAPIVRHDGEGGATPPTMKEAHAVPAQVMGTSSGRARRAGRP